MRAGDARDFLLRYGDPPLRALVRRVGPIRMGRARYPTTFDALARSIVYQQLSGKAAGTIYGRVLARFGHDDVLDPQAISRARVATLRSLGLSQQKADYVRGLARAQVEGKIPSIRRLARRSDERIIEELSAFKGVGVWTVQMLLLAWMRRPDVFPTLDLGVRKGYAATYGLDGEGDPEEMQARAEAWRPYRSAASWYFWRAADA